MLIERRYKNKDSVDYKDMNIFNEFLKRLKRVI